MRLALKVVLATVLATLLVRLAFGWVQARREIALFDADMRADHRLVGSTLGVCVASTWSSGGPKRALELVAQANADRPDLRIGWIHGDGRPGARALFSASTPNDLMHLSQRVLAGPESSGQFLVSRIPVRDQGQFLGAIEIAESLETREAYIRSSVASTGFATLAMVAVSAFLVLVLGVWLVGRPLDLLAKKAKRVGLGDLSEPLELAQRDEIGQLAQEVNAMCERLAEANARTQAETAARIRTLEQLRHADRLITVGRLAAGVAHELGTPLNVIQGRVKMLRRGNFERSVADGYLAAVAEQAERMTLIIRQLMDFARRREPKVAAADLATIARSIVNLLEPMARKRGVEVTATTSESTLALGDSAQLEQVLSNLVVNAIHACGEGGHVQVSCGMEGPEALDTTPTATARAYLRVRDDGHGMDDRTIARIFEPFFTTKDVGQGTGLGLSVAHGIVEEHGGAISVESEPGHGSTISVLLPAVRA